MNQFYAVGIVVFIAAWVLGWFCNELRHARKELKTVQRDNAIDGIGFTGKPSIRALNNECEFAGLMGRKNYKCLSIEGPAACKPCRDRFITEAEVEASKTKNFPNSVKLSLLLMLLAVILSNYSIYSIINLCTGEG